ncbi:CASP-like protein ARALYDRAFT_485429, partial [Linum perenne]
LYVSSSSQVLSFLSLVVACASASVTDLLLSAGGSFCPPKVCTRFQLSATMAFLTWFLSFSSSLFNL